MLKEALRRLLWLGPTLLLVTIPTFWAVATVEEPALPEAAASRPLFFNPTPLGAGERAIAAATEVAAGDSPEARQTLVRLGGAALPHVLPLLDSLRPEARGRVAVALAPIARRMGVGTGPEMDAAEPAVLFWTQFWEEHGIDFRPSVVRRTVRRFAEHPSALRRSEVIDLDTLALEPLVEAMHPLVTDSDVARIRQVCEAAAHVTDLPWKIPPGASVDASRAIVERWQGFFLEHQGDYVPLSGTRRLAATLMETRYGRWAARLGQRRLGALRDGSSVAATLQRRGPTTLLLVLSALLVGYPLAVFVGFSAAFRRPTTLRLGATAATLALAAMTPVGLVAVLMSLVGTGRNPVAAALSMVLGGAVAASRHQRALGLGSFERPHVRTSVAFGHSPWRAALLELRQSVAPLAALAIADLPALLTAAFVVERALSLHGLGETTVEAVRFGDPVWLMALALVGILALGVAQIGADVLAGALDPRLRAARDRRGPASP